MYILRSLSGSFSIRPLRLNLLEKDSNLDQIANFEAPAPAKPMSNLFVVFSDTAQKGELLKYSVRLKFYSRNIIHILDVKFMSVNCFQILPQRVNF